MSWKGFKRKWLWLNFKQYLCVHLEVLGENTKIPICTVSDLSEIRVGILHSTDHELHFGASQQQTFPAFHDEQLILLNIRNNVPTENLGYSTYFPLSDVTGSSLPCFRSLRQDLGRRDSSLGIVTNYELDDRVSIPSSCNRFFSITWHSDQPWNPPSLLSNR
jgi:hypothetical protein